MKGKRRGKKSNSSSKDLEPRCKDQMEILMTSVPCTLQPTNNKPFKVTEREAGSSTQNDSTHEKERQEQLAVAAAKREAMMKSLETDLQIQKRLRKEARAAVVDFQGKIKLQQENQQHLKVCLADEVMKRITNEDELTDMMKEIEAQQKRSRLQKEKRKEDEAAAKQQARTEVLESLVSSASMKVALIQAEQKLQSQRLQHEREKFHLQKEVSDIAEVVSQRQMTICDLEKQLAVQEIDKAEAVADARRMEEIISQVQEKHQQLEASLAEELEMGNKLRNSLIQAEEKVEEERQNWQEEKSAITQTVSHLQEVLELTVKDAEENRKDMENKFALLQQQLERLKKPKGMWKRLRNFFKRSGRT